MVERAYEHGKAINVAAHFEIDDVIDPAHSRDRIVHALRSAPTPPLPAREAASFRRPLVSRSGRHECASAPRFREIHHLRRVGRA